MSLGKTASSTQGVHLAEGIAVLFGTIQEGAGLDLRALRWDCGISVVFPSDWEATRLESRSKACSLEHS